MPNCWSTLARGSRPRRGHAPAREQRGGDDEREEASRPYELPDSEHLPGVKQIACTGGRCTIAVPSPEESNSGRRCCALVIVESDRWLPDPSARRVYQPAAVPEDAPFHQLMWAHADGSRCRRAVHRVFSGDRFVEAGALAPNAPGYPGKPT